VGQEAVALGNGDRDPGEPLAIVKAVEFRTEDDPHAAVCDYGG
jgi:hypothetical protein